MSSLLFLLVVVAIGGVDVLAGSCSRPFQELMLARNQIDVGADVVPLASAKVEYALEHDHLRMAALLHDAQTPIKLPPIWTETKARLSRQKSRGSPGSSPLGSPVSSPYGSPTKALEESNNVFDRCLVSESAAQAERRNRLSV